MLITKAVSHDLWTVCLRSSTRLTAVRQDDDDDDVDDDDEAQATN